MDYHIDLPLIHGDGPPSGWPSGFTPHLLELALTSLLASPARVNPLRIWDILK